MKKLIAISLIVAFFSSEIISSSYAFGGAGQILKNILRGFKNTGKNITDDVGKNIGQKIDEIKSIGNKSREEIVGSKNLEQSGQKISSSAKEDAQLIAIVGKKKHSNDFLLVKKNNKSSFSRIKNIDDLPLDNVAEQVLESKSDKTSNKYDFFYKYILINWVGKIYRSSNYYSRPELEEKMLLICKSENEIFYFALFMDQNPYKAYLINHINKDRGSILLNQELVILEDSKKEKMMSTMPEKLNKYPSHYFLILEEDQGFVYNKNKNGITPKSAKFQSIFSISKENRCFKGTEVGLYR